MNLITGLGRMFGTKSLVELGKAILKSQLVGGGRGGHFVFTGGDNIAIAIPFTCAVNGINFGDLSNGSGWPAAGACGDCLY